VIAAYVVAPLVWIGYAHRHPALDKIPGITYTGDDHPGDPINVALIGSEADLKKIMLAAKWYPADPLGLRSDVKIAADTVLARPYDEAPVSSLYLWGRKQDLAFEQPVGDDLRRLLLEAERRAGVHLAEVDAPAGRDTQRITQVRCLGHGPPPGGLVQNSVVRCHRTRGEPS